jgi:hypothetical protein
MTLYIFTEEPSAEKCFESFLPKVISESERFKIFAHGGRENLIQALKKTLPSVSRIDNAKILVTIDQDNHDCQSLKQKLEEIVKENCLCPYKIRIVCKELESWFLGDLDAISKAYPRLKSEKYRNKSEMKNVDEIKKPSEKLIKMITEAYGRSFLSKNELSEKISTHLDLTKNTSISFNQTIQAIQHLILN